MVQIVEVGPRDGFQPIGPFIATQDKIAAIEGAFAAGLTRIEVTAFVSPKAIPQLEDAAGVLAAALAQPGLDAQVLVPNPRGVERALTAGARHLVYVISASEAHNRSNVRRSVDESIAEFATVMRGLPPGVAMRLNLATSFDCPFDGRVAEDAVMRRIEQILALDEGVEIGLCDTTGRADPAMVESLGRRCRETFGARPQWVFHGHDTYGMGVANVLAAHRAGITIFDAAFGGLGGCPFAPGATGNTATEDLVYMFHSMGIETGIDLDRLIPVAVRAAGIRGASPGGRVREALTGKCG